MIDSAAEQNLVNKIIGISRDNKLRMRSRDNDVPSPCSNSPSHTTSFRSKKRRNHDLNISHEIFNMSKLMSPLS